MSYHPLVNTIQKILTDKDFQFETFEHEPVRTSEEASKVRSGYGIDQGAKALIVKVKAKSAEADRPRKAFVMFVVQGSKKFDTAKIKQEFGLSDLRFATAEETKEITGGVEFGGVPPFGNLFGLTVYVDRGLLANEKIIFNAGDKSFSIGMLTSDWQSLVTPIVGDIV